jgi:hypothetical protein
MRSEGGGFSGLNEKPDTNSELYLIILYISQELQNIFLTGCDE